MEQEKEIVEGNKLIAESPFAPDTVALTISHYKNSGNEYGLNDYLPCLKIHEDWNDLMEVIDKIIEIDITPAPQWSGYRVEIVPRGYVKISGFPMPTITTNVSICGSLIEAVWLAVVKFIKWYNTETKTTPIEH